MLLFLYRIGFWLLFPFFLLWVLAESLVEGKKVWQRLGLRLPKNGGRKRIWLHASSVGEMNVLGLLFPHLRRSFPDFEIVVSAFTSAGRKRAEAIFGPASPEIKIFYLPLDFWGLLEAAVAQLAPTALVLTETELWPELLATAAKREVSVFLANGSLSAQSARRYRWVRSVFKAGGPAFRKLLVQTERDRAAFASLGFPLERIEAVGQTKYDLLWAANGVQPPPSLASFFYWVAGSTRPGEEEKVLAAHRLLKEKFPSLKLVLAPRHLKRLEEVEDILGAVGVAHKRTSQKPDCQTPVLLLDEMGALLAAYAGARAAFVGGTLAPFGGHNLLEPLSVGTPVAFGPYVESVRETAEILGQSEIARLVSTPEELAAAVEHFLTGKLSKTEVCGQAQKLFFPWGGVSEKTAAKIRQELSKN